jgi:hypothetical protein
MATTENITSLLAHPRLLDAIILELEDLKRCLAERNFEAASQAAGEATRRIDLIKQGIAQALHEQRGAERAAAEGRPRRKR